MKKHHLLVACLFILSLNACVTHSTQFNHQIDQGLNQERWMQKVPTDANLWTKGLSRWFFTGEPSRFKQFIKNAKPEKAMTAMMIQVPEFHKIRVKGPFVLQIFGSQLKNSVYVVGPNQSVRQAAIDFHGDTLSIHLPANCRPIRMDKVIIRIGIRELRELKVAGCSRVEGAHLFSRNLNIKTTGGSEVVLEGNINVRNIITNTNGYLTVLGAYTPNLNIRSVGMGDVNVSGRVGIQKIIKGGGGNLNIIGADSDGLKIYSHGFGKVSISGFVNLKHVEAFGNSRVYVYWTNGYGLTVNTYQNGIVAVAGTTKNLNVETAQNSRFGGKYLRVSGNTYVTTQDISHVNINPSHRLFANARDESSVYYFGSPTAIDKHTVDGLIVGVEYTNPIPPRVPPPAAWAWGKTQAYPCPTKPRHAPCFKGCTAG